MPRKLKPTHIVETQVYDNLFNETKVETNDCYIHHHQDAIYDDEIRVVKLITTVVKKTAIRKKEIT